MSMKRILMYISIFLLLTGTGFSSPGNEKKLPAFPNSPEIMGEEGIQQAVLAGGCFWGIEGVFERPIGVTDVVSGYSGGEAETATYKKVGTGTTGHAESVQG